MGIRGGEKTAIIPFTVVKILKPNKSKIRKNMEARGIYRCYLKHYSCFGRFCSKEEKNYKEKQTTVQNKNF